MVHADQRKPVAEAMGPGRAMKPNMRSEAGDFEHGGPLHGSRCRRSLRAALPRRDCEATSLVAASLGAHHATKRFRHCAYRCRVLVPAALGKPDLIILRRKRKKRKWHADICSNPADNTEIF